MKTFKIGSKNINNMTEEQQIAELKTNPYRIQSIERPSEAVKLAAVQYSYGWAIHCIHAPSEQLQLAAVQINGSTISRIRNPSKTVLITAMLKLIQDHNFYLLKQIIEKYEHNNWPEIETIKKSLKHDGLLEMIKNNSTNVSKQSQLDAVRKNGLIIRYIKNPSEDVQIAAINQNYMSIEYIKKPSLKIQAFAVTKDYRSLQYIPAATNEIKLIAVKHDGKALQFIKNPSKEIITAAIMQNPSIIIYFKNITVDILNACKQNILSSINYYKKSNNEIADKMLDVLKLHGIDWSELFSDREIAYLDEVDENLNNMSEEAQIKYVQNNPYDIQFIKTPSLVVQLAAVKKYGEAIHHIKNPSLAVQLAAVQENAFAIEHIKDPNKDVVITAILRLIKRGDEYGYVRKLIKKYEHNNWPELDIIKTSLRADGEIK